MIVVFGTYLFAYCGVSVCMFDLFVRFFMFCCGIVVVLCLGFDCCCLLVWVLFAV